MGAGRGGVGSAAIKFPVGLVVPKEESDGSQRQTESQDHGHCNLKTEPNLTERPIDKNGKVSYRQKSAVRGLFKVPEPFIKCLH